MATQKKIVIKNHLIITKAEHIYALYNDFLVNMFADSDYPEMVTSPEESKEAKNMLAIRDGSETIFNNLPSGEYTVGEFEEQALSLLGISTIEDENTKNNKQKITKLIQEISYSEFIIALLILEKECTREIAEIVLKEFWNNDSYHGLLDLGLCWDDCLAKGLIEKNKHGL